MYMSREGHVQGEDKTDRHTGMEGREGRKRQPGGMAWKARDGGRGATVVTKLGHVLCIYCVLVAGTAGEFVDADTPGDRHASC